MNIQISIWKFFLDLLRVCTGLLAVETIQEDLFGLALCLFVCLDTKCLDTVDMSFINVLE